MGEVTGWGVLFAGVVLSDETDEETGPETEHDAAVSFPSGGVVFSTGESNAKTFLGEDVEGGDDGSGHEESGNPELDLELSLNVASLDVSEELADEGSKDTNGGDKEREVDGLWGSEHGLGGSRDDESSASGLGEGSEKIGTHTGNVTNVITDVISNGTWVLGRVLGEGVVNLSSEIGTDISSLGVDSTTDATEEGNSGATETVSGDEFHEVLNTDLVGWVESSLVGEEEDFEDQKSEADENESKDLSALEGALESKELVDVAEVSGLVVALGGNDHADVTTEHGSASTDNEGDHGVGEGVGGVPGHIDGAEHEDSEDGAENSESSVLFPEESDGAL